MAEEISSFRGKYHFLSNFYPCTVTLDEVEYPSVEHAYQASKTLDPEVRQRIKLASTPGQAKREGRKLKLQMSVPAWNVLKVSVMYDLLRQKFSKEPLLTMLLDTGDAKLVEGNWWNDTFWGVCKGIGENRLGVLLMLIRGELADLAKGGNNG